MTQYCSSELLCFCCILLRCWRQLLLYLPLRSWHTGKFSFESGFRKKISCVSWKLSQVFSFRKQLSVISASSILESFFSQTERCDWSGECMSKPLPKLGQNWPTLGSKSPAEKGEWKPFWSWLSVTTYLCNEASQQKGHRRVKLGGGHGPIRPLTH